MPTGSVPASPTTNASSAACRRAARSPLPGTSSVARALAAERPSSLERERQLARSGAALGSGRARRYAEARAARAREHGYAGLEDYYRERYLRDRAKLDQLADELGCHESAVRGDLKRLGLGPDRTRSHGARWKTRCARKFGRLAAGRQDWFIRPGERWSESGRAHAHAARDGDQNPGLLPGVAWVRDHRRAVGVIA
jgi:hypothetical protein